ncbi:uncharacterized protein JCM15063_003600 [Sporobolomyces koalae]|uniref:uncharacterized protein n=1 Tax=Sporobolomyces koalae TaxID=500713 RepID=UPI003180083F
MGLIPRSNHLVLIRDCYPPAPSSSGTQHSLPPPVSNGLGKLSFYAVNRPKKLPKVLHVLLERATRDRHSSGAKARQDLAVSLEIIRGLLIECGESSKEGSGELVKAVAEDALKAAELALSREGRGKQRDPELEAIGAALFATVATLLTPPFFGLQQGFGKQYLRCLSFISDLAQLEGSDSNPSRLVALRALEATARSDILYQTAQDFELQIEHLGPALVANCCAVPTPELRKLFDSSDAETKTFRLATMLSSRKPPSISAPSSAATGQDLASIAVSTLRLVARLADSSQLLSLHGSISTFLNRYRAGELWHGNSQDFIEWIASSLIAASAPSYRPGVLQWWVDQVREIGDTEAQHKSVTLLYVLATLLRGKTQLHGLGVGGVLNTLGELLIRRAKLSNRAKPPPSPTAPLNEPRHGAPNDSAFHTEEHHVECPQDRDLLTKPILSTIAALSSKIYYADQLENLVSDVIELLRGLRLEEAAASTMEEKIGAATKLVVALRLLLEEANRSSRGEGVIANGEYSAPGHQQSTVSHTTQESRDNRYSSSTRNSIDQPFLPPPVGSDRTLKSTGLVLGATTSPANGVAPEEDDVFTVRGKKDGTEQPSITVNSGDRIGRDPGPLNGKRNRVSPRAYEKSVFLLTVGDSVLRSEYVRATIVYLEQELDVHEIERGTTLPPDLTYFWKSLYTNCFILATAPSLSAAIGSGGRISERPIDLTHPLTRVRSQRSLRGMSLDSTASRPPTITTTNSVTPTGPALPFDYSSLAALLRVAQRVQSATSVLEGVPMLLALDRAAEEWERGTNGREQSLERGQATRETAALALRQVGRTWQVSEVEQIGREALESMLPSVIPPFDQHHHVQSSFAARASAPPPALYLQTVVDALAFSDVLQSVTGLDRTSLGTLLGAKWSPELAVRARSSSFVSPYANGGGNGPSRSVLQLPLGSTARIASTASTYNTASPPSRGPSSMRTPSLADLQSSLGAGAGATPPRSVHESQTPSLSSRSRSVTGGGRATPSMLTGSDASPSKRRTSKMSAEMLLASVGRRGRVNTASSMSSQV